MKKNILFFIILSLPASVMAQEETETPSPTLKPISIGVNFGTLSLNSNTLNPVKQTMNLGGVSMLIPISSWLSTRLSYFQDVSTTDLMNFQEIASSLRATAPLAKNIGVFFDVGAGYYNFASNSYSGKGLGFLAGTGVSYSFLPNWKASLSYTWLSNAQAFEQGPLPMVTLGIEYQFMIDYSEPKSNQLYANSEKETLSTWLKEVPSPYDTHSVHFNLESASITPSEVESLNAFVKRNKEKPIKGLVITGYTDAIGSQPFNKRLSYDRASSVGRYLTINDVISKDTQIKGRGEEDAFPLPNNLNKEDKKQIQNNERRVDIIISH
ncbi:OmpA family protein [Photobacterium damselae]|uniref:OmpA family protein n=1 Tax=Photobacterium damselae TaxID=38293 RepID=UPI001F19983D|nr:OmpA family protein [Photobacterium damselae]UKA03991.1 OmpA family protein [Photobacterium damselae subsp. damselae]